MQIFFYKIHGRSTTFFKISSTPFTVQNIALPINFWFICEEWTGTRNSNCRISDTTC